MAEFVEIELENALGELHILLNIGLFNKTEIRKISEQRRSNTYSLQKKTKQKEDYLRYLRYEEDLLGKIQKEREATGNMGRVQDIEGKIKNRLVIFFHRTLERFKADVELWMEYFRFCERNKLKRTANKMLTRMLQVHGEKPHLWIFASQWVLNRVKNKEKDVELGRMWLVRGIEHHPKNTELYIELIKYDLELSLKDEEKKETALACATVSFKNAAKSIGNGRFLSDLLKIVSQYPHAEELNQLVLSAVKEHVDNEDAWNGLALLELKENETGLNSCIAVFEKAVATLPTSLMWRKFVDFLKIHSKDNPFISVKLYKNVLPEMIQKDVATEEDFALLADYKISCGKAVKAVKLIENGLEVYPKSWILLHEYLRINLILGDEDKVESVLLSDIALLPHAPVEAVTRIWTMVINYLAKQNKTEKVEELFRKCLNGRMDVAQQLKSKYLQFRYLTSGLAHARDLVKIPKIYHPPCLEFYKQLIEIETSQSTVDAEFVRQLYETVVRTFGKNETEIWLDWVKFELNQRNFRKMNQVYQMATSTLIPAQSEIFVAQCSLHF